MNRQQYLAQMRKALGRMAEAEKSEILADYQEHFRAGLEEGRSEENIAAALGNPTILGRTYRVDSLADQTRKGWIPADVFRAVFASVSLGFFNIIVVLGPFLGLVGVLIGMWAVAASLGIGGIGSLVAAVASPFLKGIIGYQVTAGAVAFAFFAGVCLTGLGILAVIGMIFVTRWFLVLTARYVRFNARFVSGRKQEVQNG